MLAGLPLLAACWSQANKDLERKVDALTKELADVRGQLETIDRKQRDMQSNLETRVDLEIRIQNLEEKLKLAATTPTPTPAPTRPFRGLDPAKTYAVGVTYGHVDGPADAKVTMIVADEYACPYCQRARPTVADLRKKYGRDLRVVYKQFVVHPHQATAPALASCAASKQKKHDKLDVLLWTKGYDQRQFDTPTTLPDGTTQPCWEHVDGCPIVLGFAKEAKLDLTRFKRDMANICVTELTEIKLELGTFQVSATPTFFINGRVLSGAQPIENFAKLIDEEAAKADERIKKGTPRAKYYEKWVIDAGEKSP